MTVSLMMRTLCVCRSNALSAQQYGDICRMIEDEDVQLSRIFRKYETTKDVMHLVQDLQVLDRTLARQASATSSAAVASSTQDDDDDDDTEDDDDVDQQAESVEEEDDDEDEYNGRDNNAVAGDEDGETLNDDDAQLIERRFMQIIQNMSLSELEQTALRLAIAENDPAIRNAIDAFRSDLNEDRLVLAMRTAARAVIHRTLSSASRAEDDEEDDEENNGSGEEDEEEEEEEENDEEDGDDGEDEEGEEEEEEEDDAQDDDADEDEDEPDYQDDDIKELLQLNRALYQNNAQLAQTNRAADDEDEDDAEDDEDDEDYDNGDDDDQDDEDDDGLDGHGVSLITSKSARDHVFPILVQELVKENIISRQDGAIIMKQFADNNPIVSTALDLYDTNNDMAKLVEALQQMVDNIRDESS